MVFDSTMNFLITGAREKPSLSTWNLSDDNDDDANDIHVGDESKDDKTSNATQKTVSAVRYEENWMGLAEKSRKLCILEVVKNC